jgi:neutral trehalase
VLHTAPLRGFLNFETLSYELGLTHNFILYFSLIRANALPLFEVTGGLVSGTESSRGLITLTRPNRQWDFPFGWAPHQIMAWIAFEKYGFMEEAKRTCYRWLYT